MLFVIVSWISFIIDPQVEQSLNLIVIIKFHFGKVGTWKNVIIDYPVSCHYQHLQFCKVRLKQKFENPNFLFNPMIFYSEKMPHPHHQIVSIQLKATASSAFSASSVL